MFSFLKKKCNLKGGACTEHSGCWAPVVVTKTRGSVFLALLCRLPSAGLSQVYAEPPRCVLLKLIKLAPLSWRTQSRAAFEIQRQREVSAGCIAVMEDSRVFWKKEIATNWRVKSSSFPSVFLFLSSSPWFLLSSLPPQLSFSHSLFSLPLQ